MKRILLAIGDSIIGGAQKLFITYIQELTKKGYEIEVILPDGPLVDIIKKYDVKLHIINFSSLTSLLKINKVLKKSKFDIINAFLTKCCLFMSFINLFHKIPVCCTLLNAITHNKLSKLQKIIFPYFYRILSRLCNSIIVNSKANKKHFIEDGKLKNERIKVIYSGINIEDFNYTGSKKSNFQDKKLIIGCVGRLSIEKGQNYLIDALPLLNNIDYECLLVGDGSLRNELEKKSREYRLSKRVKFLGFQKKVAPYIEKMDIVIVPSLFETFGLSIIEAFAMKKNVVASNVGGIPELIKHRKTGLLFKSKDSIDLAKQIKFIYNNKTDARNMVKNGYDFLIKNFTNEIMVENTIKFYKKIIKKK